MKILTVDDQKRIRIPDAKSGQVYAYQINADGTMTLTEVNAEAKPAFPKGSLTKYFTGKLGRERDELETSLIT
jgi:hypothetical protein